MEMYLLSKFNVMSVNQLNAQIKLLEVWKDLNVDDFPLKIKQQTNDTLGVSTRAAIRGWQCEIRKDALI